MITLGPDDNISSQMITLAPDIILAPDDNIASQMIKFHPR
jgi:hypothetical protein